jgi:farnesyl-diphosphate farnesyltransferase
MDHAEIQKLLIKTSRSFALAASLLPSSLRHQTTVAYLTLRIADTLQDATEWLPAQRIEALKIFKRLLASDGNPAMTQVVSGHWVLASPCKSDPDMELLKKTALVLKEGQALDLNLRNIIYHYAMQKVDGMIHLLTHTQDNNEIWLSDLKELSHYCHVSAGIPVEMLTKIFITAVPALHAAKNLLWPLAARFGEGLKLTHIIKEAPQDRAEGRIYIPAGIDEDEMIARARRSLQAAREYVEILKSSHCPWSIISFCLLPLILAEETLVALSCGNPGSPLSEEGVLAVYRRLQRQPHEPDKDRMAG